MTTPHHPRGRVLMALATTAALTVLAACGGDDEPAAADPDPTGAPVLAIDGREFLASSIDEGRTIVDGSQLRISFEEGRLSANAGCNTMNGGYTLDGDTLVVDEGLAMTQMACDQALMDQETWFAAVLAASPTLAQSTTTADGDTLVMSATVEGAAVAITFTDREVADPDRPFEDTTWDVTGSISADAVSSVPEGASLRFVDGTVEVNGGCNTGSGTYELSEDGTTVTVGPVAMTLIACEGDVAELETQVLAVLAAPMTIDITAGTMRLMAGDIGLDLTAAE